MAKGYVKELVFYVSIAGKHEKPRYLDQQGHETEVFYDAKLHASFDAAKAYLAAGWKLEGKFIIRSAYIEVNGFDLGVIV